jgi:hypothetical protein
MGDAAAFVVNDHISRKADRPDQAASQEIFSGNDVGCLKRLAGVGEFEFSVTAETLARFNDFRGNLVHRSEWRDFLGGQKVLSIGRG